MTRVPMTQAVSADYADAMLVARRAKNTLFLLLLLILLIQMGVFLGVKYVPSVKLKAEVASSSTTAPTTSTSVTILERRAESPADRSRLASPLVEWVIGATAFFGVVLSVVLPVILLLIITIMLVGRLVGVGHLTSAFCMSVFFFAVLFPWQTLLNTHAATLPVASTMYTAPAPEIPRVRFPGVLYTFTELERDYDFPNDPIFPTAILGWGRFIGLPIFALFLLLIVQGRSGRGLRFALGEAEVPMEAVSTNP